MLAGGRLSVSVTISCFLSWQRKLFKSGCHEDEHFRTFAEEGAFNLIIAAQCYWKDDGFGMLFNMKFLSCGMELVLFSSDLPLYFFLLCVHGKAPRLHLCHPIHFVSCNGLGHLSAVDVGVLQIRFMGSAEGLYLPCCMSCVWFVRSTPCWLLWSGSHCKVRWLSS
jgi:hypothetical protein